MYDYKEGEKQLFDMVQKKIETNARQLMYSLNNNWKLLGVDDDTRHKRTEELVKIVQERYDEVLEETLEKIRTIKLDIEKLKSEAIKLGLKLGMQIETSPVKNDAPLSSIRDILEKDLVRYRKMIEAREERLCQMIARQKKLCHSLGFQLRELSDCPLPSDVELDEFSNYIISLEEEYNNRLQMFVSKQKAIKELLEELEEEPQGSFQYYILKSSVADFPVNDQNMSKVDMVLENLSEQLAQKKNKILDMRERLSILWERLEESPAYRAQFLSNHPGHSRSTHTALEMELQRCEEKKRQSFKLFVGKVRSEIVDMWDKCLYSDLQREKFVEFYSNIYNEDLLTLHEMYLEQIKKFYKENKDIFELYYTRQNLWMKWSELEARANEPGRYHNRGGQLLREEKERKTVSSQLPKIEAELTQLVELYENRTQTTFTVNGESLTLMMQRDWNKKNLEKKTKSSARKQLPQSAQKMAPKSEPQSKRTNTLMARSAYTATKRRLSPKQSPTVTKSRLLPRRLHLSPSTPSSKRTNGEATPAKKFKGAVPTIAINGYLLKRKSVGKRHQEKKRRSRRSRSSNVSDKEQNQGENTLASYVDFQEHLNDNADSRSSVIQGRALRSRIFAPQASSSMYYPGGQTANAATVDKNGLGKNKENMSPHIALPKVTPKAHKYASNNFGVTPLANRSTRIPMTNGRTPDGKAIRNMDTFATPRPVSKNIKPGLLTRQNTVALATPSPIDRNRPMLRSSSSHNLRSNMSPSCPFPSPKLQLAAPLPLII